MVKCRRLSPLFYEDGQIFLISRPPRMFRGTRVSAGGWLDGQVQCHAPRQRRGRHRRPPAAWVDEIERLGKPTPSLRSNFQRSGWASPGADGFSVSAEAAQFAGTARALTGTDTICGGSVSANRLLLLRAVSKILWPGKTSEVVFRRGKTKKGMSLRRFTASCSCRWALRRGNGGRRWSSSMPDHNGRCCSVGITWSTAPMLTR